MPQRVLCKMPYNTNWVCLLCSDTIGTSMCSVTLGIPKPATFYTQLFVSCFRIYLILPGMNFLTTVSSNQNRNVWHWLELLFFPANLLLVAEERAVEYSQCFYYFVTPFMPPPCNTWQRVCE